MKGSLQELITEAAETYALAQARMNCFASHIIELAAAGVSPRRIEALYPFAVEDYEQGIVGVLAELTIQRANGASELLSVFENFKPKNFYTHLPNSIVDGAQVHQDDWAPSESKLKVLLYVFCALATYDLTLEVLPGESETDAENSWSDALHEFHPANELLLTICAVAR